MRRAHFLMAGSDSRLYGFQNQLVCLTRRSLLAWNSINYTNGKQCVFGLVGTHVHEDGGLGFYRLLPLGTVCQPCLLLPEHYKVDFELRPVTPEETLCIKKCIADGYRLEKYGDIPSLLSSQLFDDVPMIPSPIFNYTFWTRHY